MWFFWIRWYPKCLPNYPCCGYTLIQKVWQKFLARSEVVQRTGLDGRRRRGRRAKLVSPAGARVVVELDRPGARRPPKGESRNRVGRSPLGSGQSSRPQFLRWCVGSWRSCAFKSPRTTKEHPIQFSTQAQKKKTFFLNPASVIKVVC